PGVTSLFQSAPVQITPQVQMPGTRQVDDILIKLVERAELNSYQAPKEIGNLQISLDRGTYGISGVGMSVTEGTVAVVLFGIQNPASEQLAAAGQVLVRELQKYYPNRNIRVLAKDEDLESKEDE